MSWSQPGHSQDSRHDGGKPLLVLLSSESRYELSSNLFAFKYWISPHCTTWYITLHYMISHVCITLQYSKYISLQLITFTCISLIWKNVDWLTLLLFDVLADGHHNGLVLLWFRHRDSNPGPLGWEHNSRAITLPLLLVPFLHNVRVRVYETCIYRVRSHMGMNRPWSQRDLFTVTRITLPYVTFRHIA